MSRVILHVDMDAFYAAVEERDRPELRGRPLIVGGTPQGRGVVAAANYPARAFGIHSAMPTAQALRRCPQAIVVAPRMSRYAEVSTRIHEILRRYTPLIEPLALDEAFLDVSASLRLFGSGRAIAQGIKQEIAAELGLVASVGIAPNKFIAKIASDLDKPDGLREVTAPQIQSLLDGLGLERIWGLGPAGQARLRRLGIESVAQLRACPRARLEQCFGALGARFWELARGLDERPVVAERDARSMSCETTFSLDIDDASVLRACLRDFSEQLSQRLRRSGRVGRVVVLKLRYDDFSTRSARRRLACATDIGSEIRACAGRLLRTRWPVTGRRVRLLGLGVGELSAAALVQGELFDDRTKQRALDRVADAIRHRFGADAVQRGAFVKHAKSIDNNKL